MKTIFRKFCKKKRYVTREFADFKAIAKNNSLGLEMRPYRCPFCQGYHLTKRK